MAGPDGGFAPPENPSTSKNSIEGPNLNPPDLAALERQLFRTIDYELEKADEKAKVRHPTNRP